MVYASQEILEGVDPEVPAVSEALEDARLWNSKMCEFRQDLKERRRLLRGRIRDLESEIKALHFCINDINEFVQDGGEDGEVAENSRPR